jgi:hypothetical protein
VDHEDGVNPFATKKPVSYGQFKALVAEASGTKRPGPYDLRPRRGREMPGHTRSRRLDLHHVRILRIWDHRGRAPDAEKPMEKAD